jgi:hypothetical protein
MKGDATHRAFVPFVFYPMRCTHPHVEAAANELYRIARLPTDQAVAITKLARRLWPYAVQLHDWPPQRKPLVVLVSDDQKACTIHVSARLPPGELKVAVATGTARIARAMVPAIAANLSETLLAAALLLPQARMEQALGRGASLEKHARNLRLPLRIVALRAAMVAPQLWSVKAINVDERAQLASIII